MEGECVLAFLSKCIQSNKNGYHRASHGWKRQVGKNRKTCLSKLNLFKKYASPNIKLF